MTLEIGVLSIQEARASAILEAAGAFDAAPTELRISGAEAAAICVTYTRGGAGGAVDLDIQVSPYAIDADAPAGAAVWLSLSRLEDQVAAQGADTEVWVQDGLFIFTSIGAAAETAIVQLPLFGVYERMRIPARESGAAGTPGLAQITVKLGPSPVGSKTLV